MITVIILSLILLIIVGIIIYYYVKLQRFKKATWSALMNPIHCGKDRCIVKPDYNLPSVNFTTDYSQQQAYYLSNLIATLELKYFNDSIDFHFPDLQVLNKVNYKGKYFGTILKDKFSTYYILLRGTITKNEMDEDLKYDLVSFLATNGLKYHHGFSNVYEDIKDEIEESIPPKSNVVCCGHSLGAGVASIAAINLQNKHNVVLYTFGSPRVFNPKILEMNLKFNHYRIANDADIVPTLPSAVVPNLKNPSEPFLYTHFGQLVSFNRNWESTLNNHLIFIYMAALKN